MTEKNISTKNPSNVLIMVAMIFVAIILAIAAFIFGTSAVPGAKLPDVPGLEEPMVTDPATPQEGVACTMDAKLCPDGSAVGRMPPNCEFSLCPGE